MAAFITFLPTHLIWAMVFAIGLTLTRGSVRSSFQPRLILGSLLACLLLVPIFAVIGVKIFNAGRIASATILLFAISPGAPYLVQYSDIFRAPKIRLALVSLCLIAGAIVAQPFLLAALERTFDIETNVDPLLTFQKTWIPIFVPLLCGFLVNFFFPRVAVALGPWVDRFFNLALVVTAVLLILRSVPVVKQIDWAAIGLILFVLVTSLIAGYLCGGPDRQSRLLTAQIAALGNPALAIFTAKYNSPGLPLEAVFTYVLIRALLLIPYKRWAKAEIGRLETVTPTPGLRTSTPTRKSDLKAVP